MYPNGRVDYLRQKFGIEEGAIVFIYLGILATGRGVDILLDSFSQTKKQNHIIFMGFGVLADKVRDYEKIFSNIHLHSAVPPEDMGRYLSGADVGVSLIENICLSYYYCLPNKLFEYLLNGLPVLVSNFPEMEKIIVGNDCGWSIVVDVEAMKMYLDALTREDIEQKRSNAIKCRFMHDWSIEEKKLLGIYANLFSS
jgi:glycosyltransferase involved in cell wall biosynthesis